MSIYQPTWLYVKQHNQTGLKYFGKTVSDPFKYLGSGKYWRRHLEVHGADVSTIWAELYHDREVLVEFALRFSAENNIVLSDEWANLKPENGTDGGAMFGHIVKETTRAKIGNANRGRVMSEEFCKMRSSIQKGKEPWNKGKTGVQVGANKGRKFGTPSDEYRGNMSKKLKGVPKPLRSSEHSANISRAKAGKPSHPQTDDARRKIGEKNSGKKAIYKDGVKKMSPPDQLSEYLAAGWSVKK